MARIDLKFIDCISSHQYIQVRSFNSDNGSPDNPDTIEINGVDEMGEPFDIWLDKSTAIRFAKTVRTEINKIKE